MMTLEPALCRTCNLAAPGHPIPVLLPGRHLADWHLCGSCWSYLERGFRRTTLDGTFEPSPARSSSRFTETQIRYYITAGLQPDTRWQQLVGGRMREIGADLEEAVAANDSQNWAAVLRAVRLIQGRAVATRGLLERMLERDPHEPALVRAIGSIRRLISDWEVESLPPDELRARMRAVLQILDRELKTSLSPAE